MVELVVDRLEDFLDLREIADPAGIRVDFALDVDGGAERMSVQTAAFVPGRYVGQAMGGFEGEFLEDFHKVLRSTAKAGRGPLREWAR
ncbi:hypothetical protein D9M71_847230 [compost metagenome]